MAISTNGGSNPTSVTYNGKNVTEVWYKSNPSATAVKVWPDNIYFSLVALNRNPSDYSTFVPTHLAVRTKADVNYVTKDLNKESGGSNVLSQSYYTQKGEGFDFSAYGEWLPGSVSIMINKPVRGPVDIYYNQTVTGNRNTLDKAIKVTYENGSFWLKNVQSNPINLTSALPTKMGDIDELDGIEFDVGNYANPHGESTVLEIRFYFNKRNKYAYLRQNHWPKVPTNVGIDHNPRWQQLESTITDELDSRYFISPSPIPFTQEFIPLTGNTEWKLKYWTLTAPDGTVQRFDTTDRQTITINQEGDWIENSYWEYKPEPTPPVTDKATITVKSYTNFGSLTVSLDGVSVIAPTNQIKQGTVDHPFTRNYIMYITLGDNYTLDKVSFTTSGVYEQITFDKPSSRFRVGCSSLTKRWYVSNGSEVKFINNTEDIESFRNIGVEDGYITWGSSSKPYEYCLSFIMY